MLFLSLEKNQNYIKIMLLSAEKSGKVKIIEETNELEIKMPFYPISLIPSLLVVETYCAYLSFRYIVHSMEENIEPTSL